jgi:hypothetical protein
MPRANSTRSAEAIREPKRRSTLEVGSGREARMVHLGSHSDSGPSTRPEGRRRSASSPSETITDE